MSTHPAFDFHVPADHPALPGHFPGCSIVPGVLLLDHVMRGLHASTGRGVVGVQRVKFFAPLLPQEVAQAQCMLEADRASFRVSAWRAGASALLAEGVCMLGPGDVA